MEQNKSSRFGEITGIQIQPRQLKIGFYSFAVVFVISLFTLKPFLASALYHNLVDIDDYKIFENREISIGQPDPWKTGPQTHSEPSPATREKLASLKTTALLMMENGEIVYENYFLDGNAEELSGSFSMAKSVVSLLVGMALQEGAIPSLDSEISTWITEWSERPEGRITVKQLLTMSSGLNWSESNWNPFSITTEGYYGSSLVATALKQRLLNPPGEVFSYQSGSTQLLGILLSRAVNRTLSQYASEKLWKPLGAEKTALWSIDHADLPGQASLQPPMEKAFCCFNAKARDFARIGQLVLQKGQWKGKTLIDPDYVKQMTSPQKVDYYGYQWWILNTPQGPVPYARGVLGQYLIVIPQKNRVLVRLGKKMGEKRDHHPEEVRALVEWALN